MEITNGCSRPTTEGPAEWFTGDVWIEDLFGTHEQARATGLRVRFEPGARTAWHTHPRGQTLVVTAGCGLVQREGGPIERVRSGDVVWFPPDEKHWHGATPDTAMTHVNVQEERDGAFVTWLEHVTDDEYGGLD